MNPERIGSSACRGGRCITDLSAGSKASDNASVTAVIMLTQRI